MQTRQKNTIVILPNDAKLEVSYFCTDQKLKEKEKIKYIDLIVKLQDCHCIYKIDKTLLKNPASLEGLVQKTVINARGHLC